MIDTKENEERGRMIAHTLAAVVDDIVRESGYETMSYGQQQQPSKFEAFRAPGISIRDYLMRIHKYASCSPECFVLALVYIDRLQRMQGFVLTHLNVHRVVITSVVLAAKFFDDHYFNNAYYAKVGGVLCKEMNELEIEYLLLINFSLHVSTDTYARFYNELVGHYNRTSSGGRHNPYMSPSPYYDVEHFVAEDPENEGQLMYVTNYNQRVPPVIDNSRHSYHHRGSSHHHHYSNHSHHPQQQYGYQQQQQPYQQQHMYQSEPQPQYAPQYQHHYPPQQQQVYHHQQQQPQHYRRRTIEENDKSYAASGHSTSANAASTASATTTATATRASGQKRRSAVALGVNA
ncbi:hypothetical protein FI667_g8291, partial [Globisporangium splendens]